MHIRTSAHDLIAWARQLLAGVQAHDSTLVVVAKRYCITQITREGNNNRSPPSLPSFPPESHSRIPPSAPIGQPHAIQLCYVYAPYPSVPEWGLLPSAHYVDATGTTPSLLLALLKSPVTEDRFDQYLASAPARPEPLNPLPQILSSTPEAAHVTLATNIQTSGTYLCPNTKLRLFSPDAFRQPSFQ
ncbi:uncharacterized protein TRIREDRAFT_104511 [Trichoderma reesei QM6a]|uniref:Predicted protein n=1 Tax=Hypocrea jecorina (strain QM6a) TaxID=431241 RepID=G0RCL3_HYPJQ|nr:uncharacterized protein TRIREDRAFT_104511 [Trichoderma reesei QM6a]EGR51244.1 predicted protein [Trichoderma reesei QM6a]